MTPIVTFTSDYGTRDEYVGSVKGVLLGLCPGATIVDLTHQIAPQAVEEAARLLQAAYQAFPEGTIHLAVVDPGVGSGRRAIAARTRRAFWVGPDNGLFAPLFEADGPATVVEIDRERFLLPSVQTSTAAPAIAALAAATFDGRDLFAPVAARLACGSPLGSFGRPLNDWVGLPITQPRLVHRPLRSGGAARAGVSSAIEGEVARIDRFGNLITNITADHLAELIGPRRQARPTVVIGAERLRLYRSYADARKGSAGALINSSGQLEIFGSADSAERLLGAGKETSVTVELK